MRSSETKFEEVLRQQEEEYEVEIDLLKRKAKDEIEKQRQLAGLHQGRLATERSKQDGMKKKLEEESRTRQIKDGQIEELKRQNEKLRDTVVCK